MYSEGRNLSPFTLSLMPFSADPALMNNSLQPEAVLEELAKNQYGFFSCDTELFLATESPVASAIEGSISKYLEEILSKIVSDSLKPS